MSILKSFALGLALISLSLPTFSQSASDVFSKSDQQFYWLGIDFSHVKLIGAFNQFSDAGTISASEIKDKFFPAWNDLVLNERTKYDFAGMFRKSNMLVDTYAVERANDEANVDDMESQNQYTHTDAEIQSFVSKYDIKSMKGIGILFFADFLDKSTDVAQYHVLAIDLQTKKVLLNETLRGKPGGFGLRNYWARSFYEVMNQVREDKYPLWKKKYSNG
jgi:hypothetical protein